MGLESLSGRPVSWSEIEVTANIDGGQVLEDIDLKSIDISSEVKRGQQKKGGRVVGQTTGELTNSASCTLYANGLEALADKLAAVAPVNSEGEAQISKVKFTIVVLHTFEDDPDARIYKKELIDCHLDSETYKFAEGVEADTGDVALNPRKIVTTRANGVKTVLL